MSDAFMFIKFRSHIELIEAKADQGDKLAQEFMERFETFYRLAKVCSK